MYTVETCLYQKTYIVLSILCKKCHNTTFNERRLPNVEKECKDKINRKYSRCYFCSILYFQHGCNLTFAIVLSAVRDLKKKTVMTKRRMVFCGGGFGLMYVPIQNMRVRYQKNWIPLKRTELLLVAVQHSLMHRVGRDDLWAGTTLALLRKILVTITHSHDHRLWLAPDVFGSSPKQMRMNAWIHDHKRSGYIRSHEPGHNDLWLQRAFLFHCDHHFGCDTHHCYW